MPREKFIVIKDADLTNNCPECYNQEIKLTFYQKHRYGRFSHRATSEVIHELKCKTCNSILYPVKWTADIERVFDYYQKTVIPEKTSLKFTPLFYVVIILSITIVAALVYFLLQEAIQF